MLKQMAEVAVEEVGTEYAYHVGDIANVAIVGSGFAGIDKLLSESVFFVEDVVKKRFPGGWKDSV